MVYDWVMRGASSDSDNNEESFPMDVCARDSTDPEETTVPFNEVPTEDPDNANPAAPSLDAETNEDKESFTFFTN